MADPVNGIQLRISDLEQDFPHTPGQLLVKRLLEQMAKQPQFKKLFGKYVSQSAENQRWASYPRFDWSLRELPGICVYEKETEEKTSRNGWLIGKLGIQVFWPAAFRRAELSRIPNIFKGALQSFFESDLCDVLLDPHFGLNDTTKVPGLNEFGKEISWTPNVEGIVEGEAVPVMIVDIKYRIDLRAWHRFLEYHNITIEKPFEGTLDDLKVIGGEYDGVTDDPSNVQIKVYDEIIIND